jgi:hypothetical protein
MGKDEETEIRSGRTGELIKIYVMNIKIAEKWRK